MTVLNVSIHPTDGVPVVHVHAAGCGDLRLAAYRTAVTHVDEYDSADELRQVVAITARILDWPPADDRIVVFPCVTWDTPEP